MTDFLTRRAAALWTERQRRVEWYLEDELQKEIMAAHYRFADELRFAQVQRAKYDAAMTEKRRNRALNVPTEQRGASWLK
jgi:hypothetical protein